MKIQLLSIALLNFFIISCQQQERINKEDAEIIQITKNEIKDEIDISKMVGEVRYVELETTEASLIGKVSKLIAYKDKIYIKDRFIASKIYIFSDKGHFITTVSNVGKGPEEYMTLDDIAIDSYRDELLISDASDKKIIVFDLEGKFLREFKTPYWVSNVFALRDHYLLYLYDTNDEKHNLLVLNKHNLEVVNRLFPKVIGRDGFTLSTPFFQSPNETLFTFSLVNEIYNITDIETGNIKTKYIFDFEDYPPLKKFESKSLEDVYDFMTNGEYCYWAFEINETEKWVMFNFMLGDQKKFAFYDKNEKSIHLGDSVTNHTDGKPFSMPMFSTGDELISVLYSYEIKDRNEELNPLLAFYRFKE